MPNIRSAKKALRQSERRKAFNLKKKHTFREAIKNVKHLMANGKKNEALSSLPTMYKALDKAAKTNVIKNNTASRVKSRITKFVSKA